MAIIDIQIGETGLAGVKPRFVYINTDSTIAEVTATGFLNKAYAQGFFFEETDKALVATKTTPSATSVQVNLFDVSFSGGDWSLSLSSSTLALADGQIFVGSAAGLATGVAMSGDATIDNTGALTIANDAITTVKILDANVTLAKLAAGIAPSHVIKFGGQHTTVGGGAAEAITVTGALATDLAFVQMVDDGTANVTIINAVVTADTLTVTFSGDPGNDAVINYQIIRAAA